MNSNVASIHTAVDHCLNGELEVALPEPNKSMEQDAEWCVVRIGERWHRVRFHDYEKIFSVPGLYERVIYDILECQSPEVVTGLLAEAMNEEDESLKSLRLLDLGAGNGMVGELFAERGAELVVGVDIIEEAKAATERDRPEVYNAYHVLDMTKLTDDDQRKLSSYRFNGMVCVAALGFGDIPTEVFRNAFNLVADDGWIAFNVKEDFIDRTDDTGFAQLIRSITTDGALDVHSRQRYAHRLGTDREPLHYIAFAGRKRRNIL
jgi:predicted TPR repeat methyltransferase